MEDTLYVTDTKIQAFVHQRIQKILRWYSDNSWYSACLSLIFLKKTSSSSFIYAIVWNRYLNCTLWEHFMISWLWEHQGNSNSLLSSVFSILFSSAQNNNLWILWPKLDICVSILKNIRLKIYDLYWPNPGYKQNTKCLMWVHLNRNTKAKSRSCFPCSNSQCFLYTLDCKDFVCC